MRNLTEVSLKNKDLVWYFIIVFFIAGIFSYNQLGRMEDPQFTVRTMVVSAAWPGATAEQMQEQVTDKLERKIQDIPNLKNLRSTTYAGKTAIYVDLNDDISKYEIQDYWKDVRNYCEDLKRELPDGVYGPYYNDRFDDVYGSIYAVTGDGYSYEEMRARAEKIRRMILEIKSVQKVELLGVQDEKVYVEIENQKLSALGISPTVISSALSAQNQMTPSGTIETESDNVRMRVSGVFEDLDAIRSMPINANGQIIRLGDIAKIERKIQAPATSMMYYNGEPAIGIAVSMKDGGNILDLGDSLNELMDKVRTSMPVGLEIHRVSDQPAVVNDSIHEFVKTLVEAIVIVLAVSFLSLGFRTGLVVAGCIPLVLAGVFTFMYIFGIDLHKVSLGALIIALGLLVDDAIIAVEMMSVKLEMGMNRFDAACYAFKATAKPMLTGTLITCAGFIPVAFSKGMASEFCSALFPVIGMALVLSWIVSVMVAPLFGTYLIKVKVEKNEDGEAALYDNKFYDFFRKLLSWFLNHRRIVLVGTLALFIVSAFGMKLIKQEFFPPSIRPEILVEMNLPDGSSIEASQKEARKLADILDENMELIDNYSYYVGRSVPRFVLTVDPKPDDDARSHFVIVAKDTEAREKLTARINKALENELPAIRGSIKFIQTGPPADYPIMLRVSGYDTAKVKALADQVADRLAEDSNVTNVNLDWSTKSKALKIKLDQDKLRGMGVTSQAVAQTLYTELTGATAAQFYSGDRTVAIQLRLTETDRKDLSEIKSLPVYVGAQGYVPLEQIAEISYEAEYGTIKRRNLKPCITVQADIKTGTANDATTKAMNAVKDIQAELPLGYSIEAGGALENSKDSTGYLLEPLPAMVFILMTLLMFQLRSGKQMLITLLTAPLGIIGVTWGMLLFDKSMGFVAILGVLALSGMIIRNSVILIDQIQKHMADGETPWDAVVDSAILRFRPIMLTAAAAILGMVPLMVSSFWGPMAVAIASGLLVATVLTLLVLPTMYAAVYNVRETHTKE